MNIDYYVEGRRSARIAFMFWFLCLILLAVMGRYKVQPIFDPLALSEPPQHSFWYVFIMAYTYALMWIGGGYLFYLGSISIRHGAFPPSTAIYPVRTKQRRGFLAYLSGLILFVTAIGFVFSPIALNIMSNREIDRTLTIHKRLIEEGVLTPSH